MRKYLRIGVAALLATSGLIVIANSSSAQENPPVNVIDCHLNDGDGGLVPGGPRHTDAVSVPGPVPVLGGEGILAASDSCAELRRTLVFQGVALIDNGVNFAGVGGASLGGNGLPAGQLAKGGTYGFTGICVLVNWQNPDLSAEPVVTGCGFNNTPGFYAGPSFHGPDGDTTNAPGNHANGRGNGLFRPIGSCLEHGNTEDDGTGEACGPGSPGYTGLDWGPDDQASCFNSDGRGTSSFTALGGAEEWTATYSWNDSLDNLRGDNTRTVPAGGPTVPFDAKIEAQAYPLAASPLDATAVGCLQKTVQALTEHPEAGGAGYTQDEPGVGLNDILIVGTATWETVVPEILFP